MEKEILNLHIFGSLDEYDMRGVAGNGKIIKIKHPFGEIGITFKSVEQGLIDLKFSEPLCLANDFSANLTKSFKEIRWMTKHPLVLALPTFDYSVFIKMWRDR